MTSQKYRIPPKRMKSARSSPRAPRSRPLHSRRLGDRPPPIWRGGSRNRGTQTIVKMADQQQETKKSSSLDKKDGPAQGRPVEPKDLQDLTQHVQDLLQHMQDKFTLMSEQILGRIDDMSHRIEDLERNINDIVTHVGLEAASTPTGTGPTTGIQQTPPHGKEPQPADVQEKQ
ncbi:hypothetical protein BIW11_09755 [Tropilaelaps mercedesae]|uniref:Heat shock factor-binding protein 1 n=1 Tax=Tropilaelaps mercedesae TaxID=418985 RepID=A0A1V9XIX7_9ACAR|nr:hypothetical protein BIW11_09755 [Tropilaelaps mercedesae]